MTKLFTPSQANQTLPLVKKIVGDILSTGQQIRDISARISTNAEKDPEIIRLMGQLEELFEEIENIGCYYKDWNFSIGLVDFPSVIDGKEVLLCWRSDEEELKYYHGPEEGFSARKLIPLEKIK